MEVIKGNCQPCAQMESPKSDKEKAEHFLKMMREEFRTRAAKGIGRNESYNHTYETNDTKISKLTERVEKLEKLLDVLANKEELERLKKLLEIE